jgi:hypothetical protein
VAGLLSDDSLRYAYRGSGGGESRSETVTGNLLWIEPGASRVTLHNGRRRTGAQASGAELAVAIDRGER